VYQQAAGEEPTIDDLDTAPTFTYVSQGRYHLVWTPDSPTSNYADWEYILDHAAISGHGTVTVRAVAAAMPTLPTGSPYATAEAVAAFMEIAESALPSDIARLCARASELVDYSTLGNLDTTDDDHLDAAQRAVCAQVEHWINHGEDDDTGSTIRSYSIGKTSFAFGSSSGSRASDAPLCKRAYRILATAGLVYCAGDVGVGRVYSQPI
jgi:hypothetical protein